MATTITEALKQVTHEEDKLPGWGWLLVGMLWYLGATEVDVPVLGKLPEEAIAIVLTWVFYTLGDVLDEWRWPKLSHTALISKWADDPGHRGRIIRLVGCCGHCREGWLKKKTGQSRRLACHLLGVGDGVYAVSKALLKAARKDREDWGWFSWSNELAKVARSLVCRRWGQASSRARPKLTDPSYIGHKRGGQTRPLERPTPPTSDSASAILTMADGRATRTIVDTQGCQATAGLRNLEQTIDRLLNTTQWIGTREERKKCAW